MASLPTRDLAALLSTMQPVLHPGRYAYVAWPAEADPRVDGVVATMREAEGMSAIVEEHLAREHGLRIAFTAAWISLSVHSDLDAVGLTAAFAGALGEAGISCHVVAGLHHDHLFVPLDRAQDALRVLHALQASAPTDG